MKQYYGRFYNNTSYSSDIVQNVIFFFRSLKMTLDPRRNAITKTDCHLTTRIPQVRIESGFNFLPVGLIRAWLSWFP